ncbi:hypothetical protein Q8791_29095 [Nocardiopsis sp. CT-R113]|uniref:DUF1640 domain-containing protein n=1 Tax=Nocardiopsis codii TaxID=3065942 RepID=A0ABU7KGD4_9ACTN|nr:hypothetical protein [Nocardiopsis sp. CT-R113]MEE2041289.1 hypothetical protein [Nocardiopsis sp. CT-R113]
MTDPLPYRHLGELLTLMREEMRNGFADLKSELGERVSVDVYEADKRLAEERLDRVAAELAELRAEAARAKTLADAERTAATDRRAADRRMIWGALIAAALSLAVGLLLAFLSTTA